MMPGLTIEHLDQVFEAKTVNAHHVLHDIQLRLEPGEFVTIIGGNGAGKSTLLNTIAGTVPITHGHIWLNDREVTYQSVSKRARMIARVFQDPLSGTAPSLTIEENMALAQQRGQWRNFWASGVKKRQRELFKARLAPLELGMADRLMTPVSQLSGGQRQALTLLMATLTQPELLLLDEHTAALDPQTSESVMALTAQLVDAQHLTTLMITHNMASALRYGDRLIMLDHGRIVVDVAGEAKKALTVTDLLDRFKANSGQAFTDDGVLLG